MRLENGVSQPFDVLLRERDRVAALGRRIEAFERYRVARVQHDRALGTVLDEYGVELDVKVSHRD